MKSVAWCILFAVVFSLSSCDKGGDPAVPKPPVIGSFFVETLAPSVVVVTTTIADSGQANITRKGYCWSKNGNPTIDSAHFFSLQTSHINYRDTIRGLPYGTNLNFRAFAENSLGISYGPPLTVRMQDAVARIGDNYGGGVVFYVDSSGEHGMVAAPPLGYKVWADWPYTNALVGNTSWQIGAGKTNTQKILASGSFGTGTAAGACDALIYGGQDDWFLPSWDELTQLKLNKDKIPFFANFGNAGGYWTSQEATYHSAFLIAINASSSFNQEEKGSFFLVAPVREF